MEEEQQAGGTERLWTPWRMNYVGGGTKEEGCIFCNRLQRDSDVESLILYRAEHSFVIMNLYPYNTGHIMLVPNEHASDPSGLAAEALAEMGVALPTLTTALRRAFGCHGFNVGLNIGAIAGAGVEAHLHQHIVPRWQGDANFMPIIASTMTIPELIPVTYAKIRAELAREITGATSVRVVVLTPDRNAVLMQDGSLPSVDLNAERPVVQAIAQVLPDGVSQAQLAGWAGPERADNPESEDVILTFFGTMEESLPAPWSVEPVQGITDPNTADVVKRAVRQLAPSL